MPNRAPLEATPFIHLPLGAVRPQGWLLRQMNLQKAGLTGSAEQLYDALKPDSGWLGGPGENWEKGPYYIRGLIALAYTLDDAELKQRAQKWIDWALQSQKEDGSFGPAANDDWWPRMVVLWYLRDYQEATGDPRVIPFFTKYFQYQLKTIPARPLRDWGMSRAGDNIDVVLWTYNRTGDPSLIALARFLYSQAYPWTSIYINNRFYDFGGDFQPHHIVNVSQALKFPATSWQFTHDEADKKGFGAGVENLNKHYGRIDGQVSGTEMLSGLKSTDGVEFCADIERIISDGVGISVLGDPAIADNMEKVAYNSVPAHTSPRMQQMTYYQLLNQASCVYGGHGFHEDYSNGNVPGPYSGFPCCCYNWHTAWPKFTQQMWAATPDNGLALIAYGPNQVTTTVGNDVPITITQETDYPFTENISLKIEPQKAATFPLILRIPGWCDSASIKINDAAESDLKSGTFHRIVREWKPGDRIEIQFPMTVRASTWTNDSIGLERGPLAFALAVQEQWKPVKQIPGGFNEFEVTPKSPWNYALQTDRSAADVRVTSQPVSAVPFDTDSPPVTLSVSAKRLPGWGLKQLAGKAVFGKADHSWQQLTEATASLEPDIAHHLRVETKGKSIRLFVDNMDRPVIDTEDTTYAGGKVGLRAYDSKARFNDLSLNGKKLAGSSQPFGGKWSTTNHVFEVEPAKDAKLLLSTPDLNDFTLDATLTLAAGGDAGLIFRASDLNANVDGYRGYYIGLSARKGEGNDAAEPPKSPVTSDAPAETVELIPFGSAKLRISYFPVLQQ